MCKDRNELRKMGAIWPRGWGPLWIISWRLTALRIYAMQMGDETIELLNAADLEQTKPVIGKAKMGSLVCRGKNSKTKVIRAPSTGPHIPWRDWSAKQMPSQDHELCGLPEISPE